MSRDTAIAWAHHTFNPWWGCTRVSEACEVCYAEAFAKRVGQGVWGPQAPRRFFGDKHWHEPFTWDAQAQREGADARVFCASMADVFEARDDLVEHRERLWGTIGSTPFLTWMLLTKRPENVRAMVPRPWLRDWPRNVWLGSTAETQQRLEARSAELAKIPAGVRFLSCEPLYRPLDLAPAEAAGIRWAIFGVESAGAHLGSLGDFPDERRWLAEVAGLVMECGDRGIAPFVKQIPLAGRLVKRLEAFPREVAVQEFPA